MGLDEALEILLLGMAVLRPEDRLSFHPFSRLEKKVELAASVHFTSRVGMLCFLGFAIFSDRITKNRMLSVE